MDQTNNPNVTLVEVAEMITKDIAMSAKILKLVNSAFFGFGRNISDLNEAISYLGIETIKKKAGKNKDCNVTATIAASEMVCSERPASVA